MFAGKLGGAYIYYIQIITVKALQCHYQINQYIDFENSTSNKSYNFIFPFFLKSSSQNCDEFQNFFTNLRLTSEALTPKKESF